MSKTPETSMKVKKDSKGNPESIALHNVQLFYCNVKSPRPIYDDRDVAYEKARKEYSVVVAVTEDVADQWDELFPKQPAKKFTNAKFKENFKLEDGDELPFPDEKKQFVIKTTQKAQKENGDPISDMIIPRVFHVENGKASDITFEKNVGNGSFGSVLIRCASNTYGNFAYLNKIKIVDLIEYESSGPISEEDKEFLGVEDVELAEKPSGSSGGSSGNTDDDVDDFLDDDEGSAKESSQDVDDDDEEEF